MRHLITGGSGFLGNLICRELAVQGNTVVNADIWQDETQPSKIDFQYCDVTRRSDVERCMQNVDIVHNNVALVPLTKSGKRFWEVNVEGCSIVAEEAKKAGVKHFIHMSSSAIYGVPKICPISQDASPMPIEIYGRAKLAGENAVRKALEGSNTQLIIIRPRTILGPDRLGIFQILFEWIKENKNVYVIGSGDINFQFIHISDLMSFYMHVLKLGCPGTYNVGTDRFGTLRQALENLIDYAGSTSKVVSLPQKISILALTLLDKLNLCPLAPWHYLTYHKPFHFDIQPLLDLDWKPIYSNDDMLKESYNSFVYSSENGLNANLKQSLHRKPVKQKLLKLLKAFS